MEIGTYLIFIGLVVVLLDWLQGMGHREIERGELKFGNISIKGSAGILIFLIGVVVYLLENGFVKL